MRINLSTPFHWLQWYTYIVIIFIFQLMVIFPLSCIIFNDLYNRLISLDSIQTIPLNTLITPHNYKFEQYFMRYDFSPLPDVFANGINQLIPLRSTIEYKLDVNIKFYCQHRFYGYDKYKPNMELLDTIKVKIWINDDPKNQLLYKVKLPVVCSNKDTSESSLLLESGLTSGEMIPARKLSFYSNSILSSKHTFMDSYHDNWLNELIINDKISIPTKAKSIHILLDSTSSFSVPTGDIVPHTIEDQTNVNIMKRLTFDPMSHLKFKTIYEQGIRNFMLRHNWITYIVGVTVVHSILLVLFLLTGLYCFYRIISMNNNDNSPGYHSNKID
ncbi:seipin [Monosporozyma servazzii]